MSELVIPTKQIGITMFGKKINLLVPKNYTDKDFFDSFAVCKRLMAEFYFPFLITADNVLLSLERDMMLKGKYRFEAKKNFRQLQASIRKRIKTMELSFAVADYFNELSAQVWEDVKDNIERLRYAIYLVISRHGVRKEDAETYALLIVAANIIYMSYDTFMSIIQEVKKEKNIDFSEVLEHTSCISSRNLASNWCNSYIKNFQELEPAITKDMSVRIGRDAINTILVNEKNMTDRELRAYNEMPQEIKVAWHPMTERPHNRRRILIYKGGKMFSYLYRKGILYGTEGEMYWRADSNEMWIYENERDKKSEFVA